MKTIDELLKEIEARAEMATPRHWYTVDHYLCASGTSPAGEYCDLYGPSYHNPAGLMAKRDAEFIAHARTDVPTLIAMLRKRDEQLRREIAKHIKNPWQGVTAMEQYDAELLKLAEGEGKT